MAKYEHYPTVGLPGEGIAWFDDAGVHQVGYICFAFENDLISDDTWRVAVWQVSANLEGVPHNLLLAALPSDAWLNPERRLPYLYPESVDGARDRQGARAAYNTRVNTLVADIAVRAGDLTLMTLLVDGMSVAMALEALQLLDGLA